MKQSRIDEAIEMERRMAAGEKLRGREWRRYRRVVTAMRRARGDRTTGHAIPGNQRLAEDGPALAAYDREGRLVPIGQGRRGRA